VAADRFAGSLPDLVSEADLMRRYGVARGALARVLNRMSQVSVIERRNGHGWRFLPALDSKQLHDESYRFRLLVEPASMLEPTFRLDRSRAQRLREAHLALLAAGPDQMSSHRFFDLNTEFHEFIAACSGNRFLQQAVLHQHRLRRFFSYIWVCEPGRMGTSCTEHVAILNRLIGGDREQAAVLLRRHLLGASRIRPRLAQ
jgi:DNA-binding GntR family transcriptional regulator